MCDVLHLPFCQMDPNFLGVWPQIEISSENVGREFIGRGKQQSVAKN